MLLRLFIAGASERSRRALRLVNDHCGKLPRSKYKLEVVDIYQQPESARSNQIIATPTLIKYLPTPVQRFIGDLSDLAQLRYN